MTTDLIGLWHYNTEDNPAFAAEDCNHADWPTMRIPGNWFLGGLDHHGAVWFRTQFRHRPHDEFASLQFDGVDYFCDVYLNGQPLSHHTGYFDPFAFDVTGVLRPGKNTLAVRVDSPYETPGLDGWHLRKRLIKGVLNHHDCRPGGGWEQGGQAYNTGGIWNRVRLEEHGALTVDCLLLHADLDAAPPVLHAELTVRNRTRKRAARLEVRVAPENFKGKPQVARFKLDLPAGESVHKVELPVKDARLWQPWERGFPHLYQVTAALTAARETAQRGELFGFRSVRVDDGYHWFLNGQPFFPRGSNYLPSQWLSETLFPEVAEAPEHPFGYRSSVLGPRGWFERDVALAKHANLNMLRVHAHVLPSEFHEACDRAGLLVWQDFPFQWGYSDEPEFCAEAERQVRAMVTQLHNHPSIAAWCCHNESPCDAPWMANEAGGQYDPSHNRALDERIEEVVRSLDPTRYTHRNSGTGDGHVYPGWYVGHWRDFHTLPGAPFLTEYGAQALPVKENVLRMLPQYGPDAGFAQLLRFKAWLETQKKVSPVVQAMVKVGTKAYLLVEKLKLRGIQEWMQGWGIKVERSAYKHIPSEENTPAELRPARAVWEAWRFHDFQPAETFDMGISPGNSLDEFIANSQAYQSHLIQYATETYRRAKDCPQNNGKPVRVTGVLQFDFTDPWPAITWSVLDYWRAPKAGFDALRRAMQPVLPSFQVPEKIEAGKATPVSFRVVNDSLEAHPQAVAEWRLKGKLYQEASAAFPVSIPANGVSDEVKLTLPSLNPGVNTLSVTLTTGSRVLGENSYTLHVE